MARSPSTVGPYRILDRLGIGGMATVYLAEPIGGGDRVALKLIHPNVAAREELLARFFNEARALSQIHHPHVISVVDCGRTLEGDCYIAMELLTGATLKAELAAGPLPVLRAVSIACQIADAVGAAHALGIVHRDLKPENVMLIGPGLSFAKVLDFGVAKLTRRPDGAPETSTGMLLGTPMYMAPETLKGARHADARADIYGLGCVLFELLTGRPPFVGQGFGDVLVMHLEAPPPALSTLRPDAPAPLSAAISRALAKDPDARFTSMAELSRALVDATGPFAEPPTIPGVPPLHATAPVPLPGSPKAAALAQPVQAQLHEPLPTLRTPGFSDALLEGPTASPYPFATAEPTAPYPTRGGATQPHRLPPTPHVAPPAGHLPQGATAPYVVEAGTAQLATLPASALWRLLARARLLAPADLRRGLALGALCAVAAVLFVLGFWVASGPRQGSPEVPPPAPEVPLAAPPEPPAPAHPAQPARPPRERRPARRNR